MQRRGQGGRIALLASRCFKHRKYRTLIISHCKHNLVELSHFVTRKDAGAYFRVRGLNFGRGPIRAGSLIFMLVLLRSRPKKGQEIPKLCDGGNGKRNTNVIGIGHFALYIVRLETYAFNITQRQISTGATAPHPPRLRHA